MSAATLQPSAKEKPRENVSQEESNAEGDELPSEAAVAAARRAAEDEGGAGDGGEGGISETGPSLRRYSREQLLEMRSLPLSKRRPDCLPEIYNSALSSWDGNKKRSETPNDDDRGGRETLGDKRRSGDPRERIRKESEGIVLSPQRRSFNSGCFVMSGGIGGIGGGAGAGGAGMGGGMRETRLRPDSPISYDRTGDPKADMNAREQASRRIGSGRIMSREMAPWERGGEGGAEPGDHGGNLPYRPPRERGEDRYERRSFGRDVYGNPEKTRNNDRNDRNDRDRDALGESRFGDRRDRDDNRRGNRYNERRRYDKDEEPEWFSGGPTSQHDTIELRGFDDPIPITNVNTPSTNTNSSLSTANILGSNNTNTNSKAQDSGEQNNSNSNTNTGAAVNNGNSNANGTSGTGAAGDGVRVRQNRRSAGSGRTPSAVAANQNKDQPLENNFSKVEEGPAKQNEESANRKVDLTAPSDFNLEEFLKLDTIPGLLTNGGPEEGMSGGSRFSRYFRRESPPPAASAPSAADEAQEQMLASIINGQPSHLEPSISIPSGDSQHLFAPISPAASSTRGTNSLLEMLQRGQQQQQHQHQHQQPQQHQQYHHKPTMEMPGKIHSLEELEARMLGNVQQQHQQQQQQQQQQHLQQQQQQHLQQQQQQHLQQQQQQHRGMQQHQPPQDDDINAFKKMMAQALPSSNGPISSKVQGPPMSLLQEREQAMRSNSNWLVQMLNKSQQEDQQHQAAMEAQHIHQHQQAAPAQPPSVSQEMLYKLFQVQQQNRPQEHVNKVMPSNVNHNHSSRHYQVSPIPNDLQAYMNNLQPSRDLLQRPEAQAIVHGLKQGEITPGHLMQQISNPALQSRHRELLASILKLHDQSSRSPRNTARLALPPQQQLRVSPLPPNAFCVSPIMATSPNTLAVHHPGMPQRIPSPRELQAHTQNIMQSALIKKKLEEQKENFRRRQEQQHASLGSPTKHQQAAMAFTPTSVLRNMTAGVDKEPESKISGWGAPPTHIQPQPVAPKHGRPIVKQGNGGGMGVPSAYQPPLADFPAQQFLNHHPQQQYVNNMQQQMQQQQAAALLRNKMAALPSHQQFGPNMVMQMQGRQHQMQQVNNNGGPMGGGASFHQLLMHSQRNHSDGGHVMPPALSPTSNQLAQWFTPELLAQATAGKLPSVNSASNVLSLEELERIQHEAIVHN